VPTKIRKLKSGKFRVYNSGKVTAKSTTRQKARSQVKLLRAVEHGWKPTGVK
jgi:hypothetical protein